MRPEIGAFLYNYLEEHVFYEKVKGKGINILAITLFLQAQMADF